jgi:hypothetical protein
VIEACGVQDAFDRLSGGRLILGMAARIHMRNPVVGSAAAVCGQLLGRIGFTVFNFILTGPGHP